MAEQKTRRYRQFAGFPGANGVIEVGTHGVRPVKPLTEAERADMLRAGIPHDPQQPLHYVPPPAPYTRKIGIELLGPLGLVAVVSLLFFWLLRVPASGEGKYYGDLLGGKEAPAATDSGQAQ